MSSIFQDDKGNGSMNRVLSFMGGCTGVMVAIAGIVHLFAGKAGDISLGVILAGLAVFGGSVLLKNAGRRLENGGGK